MDRLHLQAMTEVRISDGAQLIANKSYSAAYYLLGYAIELGLKSSISKQFSANVIPDKALVQKIFTHDFDLLVGLAGLKAALKDRAKSDQQFAVNWTICKEWTPESRYANCSAEDAMSLYLAITDNNFGVLPWIKRHW